MLRRFDTNRITFIHNAKYKLVQRIKTPYDF